LVGIDELLATIPFKQFLVSEVRFFEVMLELVSLFARSLMAAD